ncbi:MAG: cytochrome c [Anaerolineales bacterium]|nr:cytochrome c [Anaerolineales bacterium]
MLLVAGTYLIASAFFSPTWGARPMHGFTLPFLSRSFESNGERIYFTGTSDSGPPITSQMLGMHSMRQSSMSCASCHGSDGRGGTVRMMMATFNAPDIRYSILTEGDHDDDHGHPAYTDEDIIRAITLGVNPAGEPLDWAMPRWSMSDEQLQDLLEFLKTLD